jgi:rsbT co-antagonist protein RsbR
MQMPQTASPDLTPDDKTLIREYWLAYDPLRSKMQAEIQDLAKAIPDFAPIVAAMTPQQMADEEKRGRELEKKAFVDGDWNPFLQNLQTQGATYAQMGVAFSAWYRLMSGFRPIIVRHLEPMARQSPAAFERVTRGMNLFVDFVMGAIGDSYLHAKQGIIQQQQSAIRELSTPVLQVRERLLIIPLVGVVDTHRARHLTESMLRAIRDRRARAVVIDITGVPIVDSKVANHLVQACEAARLMGARVILSGLSAEIAQALVTIGAELTGVPTVADLQSGLEEAEHLLGYRTVKGAETEGGEVAV